MMSPSPLEIPILEDVGPLTPEVGDWAEDKYRLVKLYANLFTTSMRRKWEELIYIDLFAGAGRARVRGAERIVPASPLLALSVDPRFDRHMGRHPKVAHRPPARRQDLGPVSDGIVRPLGPSRGDPARGRRRGMGSRFAAGCPPDCTLGSPEGDSRPELWRPESPGSGGLRA